MNTMKFRDLVAGDELNLYMRDVYNGNKKHLKVGVHKSTRYGGYELNLTYLLLTNGAEFVVPSDKDVFKFSAIIGDNDMVLQFEEENIENINFLDNHIRG